ncbi:MAG TPA: hypothetical protein VKH35_12875 [Thermoanaerobaculia bacterium]|nr:hypothetical protein [Thermoanaerobaculia bacterium]
MRRMIPALPLALFGLNVVAFSILRLLFFLLFRDHPMAPHDLGRAFYLGLKFDARFAAILVFPLLLIGSHRSSRHGADAGQLLRRPLPRSDPRHQATSAAFVFTTFHQPPRFGLVQGGRYTMVLFHRRGSGL